MTREEAERELSRERPILWGYTEDKVHILFRELLITERLARREAEERVKELEERLDNANGAIIGEMQTDAKGYARGLEEAAKVVVEYAGGSDYGSVNLLKLAERIRQLIGGKNG
jgi:hypothetical protein